MIFKNVEGIEEHLIFMIFFEHIQMVSLAKGVQIGGLEMNTNRLLGYSRLDLQG